MMGPDFMALSDANARRPLLPAWFWTALIYAISIGCLVYVFWGFDWKSELPRIRRIHWAWIAVAVVCDILVYVTQGIRWNLLLSPIQNLSLWRTVQAIYIGLFANEVLPMKGGEAVRIYLVSHWNRLPFPTVLSSGLLERLVDGIWLMAGFYLAALLLDLPKTVDVGANSLGILVLVLGAVVAFAFFNKSFAHHVAKQSRFANVLRTLVEGLHQMGRSRSFWLASAVSIVYLGLQVFPIHAMIRGYDVPLTLAQSAVVFVIIRLSSVVPGPPGNVGIFHIAAFTALHNVMGIDRATAQSLSAVMFFMITVPLLVAGLFALLAAGLNLKDLLQRARAHHSSH